MQKDADAFQPKLNTNFVLSALKSNVRVDGRGPFDSRPPTFSFAPDDSCVTVSLGRTRALAVVRADLEVPRSSGSNEGRLLFNVDFSPMASTSFEQGRMGRDATQIANLVERSLKDSQAIDLEALNVLTGRKAWTVRVDVRILDHDGNLADVAVLAAIAALTAFRLPQVEVSADGVVTVYSPADREPMALTIQHIPFATTFAIFESGHVLALDPSLLEEASATGAVTIVSNAHDELCGVHKAKGTGMSAGQLMRCVRLGNRRAQALGGALRAALDVHKLERVRSRVKRRAGAAADAAAPPPAAAVATLPPSGGAVPLSAMSGLCVGDARDAGDEEAPGGEARGGGGEPPGSAAMESEGVEDAPAGAGVVAPGAGDIAGGASQPGRARLVGAEAPRKKKKRKSTGGDGRGVKRPGIPDTPVDEDPSFDHFGAISAMIAGAAPGDGPRRATLADSIKTKKK